MEWTANGSESNLEGGLVRGGRSEASGAERGRLQVAAKTDSDAVALVTIIYNPLDGGSRALGLEARFRSCGCRSSGGSWKHLEISLHHG